MATTPTNLPVPSESPRDLKFNAGKIDEFVTSMGWTYTDRFGQKHYTIEGINYLAQQVMNAFGYVTLSGVTFTTGATVSNPNEVLFNTADNTYYKWTGSFAGGPKVVPANSTPQSSGGVGVGKWLSVGDTVLRTELQRGQYRTDATSCYYVTGFVIDQTTDNRDASYAFPGKIYIPKDLTVRCNFLPDDDVTKFVGEGQILTRDPWGNEHIFDVSLASNGSKYTAFNVISQNARLKSQCRVGIIGDSITDGQGSNNWTANPTDSSGNLSSTNYDHNNNGGAYSWFRVFVNNLNRFVENGANIFIGENCGSAGKKLIDGWAYRNFDYGFFKNTAYGSTAPKVCFMSMGVNDNGQIENDGFETYLSKFEQFIRKAWGYGCAVCIVSMNQNGTGLASLEIAIKKRLNELFPALDFLDLANAVTDMYRDPGSYALDDIASLSNAGNNLDIIHFGTLGHQYIGAYAAKEIMPWRVFEASRNNLIPTSPNDVQIIGYPSNRNYIVSMVPFSGSRYLDELGGWGCVFPTSETVTFRYFVWCNDSNTSLVVFEPSGPTYTTANRANSISVRQQDFRNGPYISSPLASTGVSTFANKLTSIPGILKKGLNQIEIIYDGNPSRAFPPGLLFRGDMSESITLGASVFLSSNAIKGVYGQVRDRQDLLLDYLCSSANDESVDMFGANKSPNVQNITLSALPIGCGAVFYYKPTTQSGVIAKRTSSGIEYSTMLWGVSTVIATITCDASGEISMTAENVAGVSTITVKPTSGSTVQQAVPGFSGGKIALINKGTSSVTAIVKSASQIVI